ncbi:MAG: hypothetical protein HY880_03020, partial [Deltaproteobacteria bacterium]|nr:hypothetical protein [Deltaproteobacteria bacterium]
MAHLKLFLLIIALFIVLAIESMADTGLEIGRMRVAIWPEYDSSGVLFIYDGRFKDQGNFPTDTVFYIPANSSISDACSLSPKGQHFCQLYTQTKEGDFDAVRLKLPYPNFYLSFHTEPFDLKNEKMGYTTQRALTHVIKANHKIEKLEVDVQSPLRAEGFTVLSPEGFTVTEKKGFAHYQGSFEDIERGRAIEVSFEYIKKDSRPSVDIKYSPGEMVPAKDAPFGVKGFAR